MKLKTFLFLYAFLYLYYVNAVAKYIVNGQKVITDPLLITTHQMLTERR